MYSVLLFNAQDIYLSTHYYERRYSCQEWSSTIIIVISCTSNVPIYNHTNTNDCNLNTCCFPHKFSYVFSLFLIWNISLFITILFHLSISPHLLVHYIHYFHFILSSLKATSVGGRVIKKFLTWHVSIWQICCYTIFNELPIHIS